MAVDSKEQGFLSIFSGSDGITQPYVTIETYGLSNVDGSGNLNIDLSGADTVEIVGTLSLDSADRGELYLSEDSGSTAVTNIYNNIRTSGTSNAVNTNATYVAVWGGATGDSTGNHYGIINITGAATTNKTKYSASYGTVGQDALYFWDGFVDNNTVYNTLQVQPGTANFDAVDITVYKYSSSVVYTTDGMQVTTYGLSDLVNSNTELNIDLGGYDVAEVVVSQISNTLADKAEFRFSTDGGSTFNSTNHKRWALNATGEIYFNNVANDFFGNQDVSNSYIGHIKITGHNSPNHTYYRCAASEDSGGSVYIREGVVPTTDVYDTLNIYADTGAFDGVDITVYRYNVSGNINIDGVDGDKIPVSWNPTNYTPDSSISEADDADDLAAHLKGIDSALSSSLELIGSYDLSVQTLDTGNEIDVDLTGYISAKVIVIDSTFGTSSGVRLRLSDDNGSTFYSTSTYESHRWNDGFSSNTALDGIPITTSNTTTTFGITDIFNLNQGGLNVFYQGNYGTSTGGSSQYGYLSATTSAVSHLRAYSENGNAATGGTMVIYGLK